MAIGHFPTALQDVMKRQGYTLAQVGRAANIDGSQVGKIVKGTRKASEPVMRAAAEHYDDGQLFLAAAAEVTGGAFTPWLDNVDLHRASVLFKTIEEMQEVLDASKQAAISKTNEQINETERQQIKRLLMETVEAITALSHLAAAICKEYSFSWLGTWKEHRAELKLKNYVK
ncbi:transcriptional regulator [Paenibacillus sp. FSL H7-0357]|uniref:helix-turn-helix domain-containing protein n=2 Tax=Paenibacillus sp. FSL H7-0357 TaxID=1536774 RepID=UPI0004F6AC69|nr:helix-turn-helix transcriptional regulator [Paenibacillus sp. FSL H7-0357]AIQ17042.1 transcriptional regulator [Paenibacillus sp. FSL H7-0357]